MGRKRTLPPLIELPSHNNIMRKCIVMTEVAVHTVGLAEGHFVAVVLSNPDIDFAIVDILDRDDVDAQYALIRNAMDDAELLDAGKTPIHCTPSLRRN